LFSFLNSIPIVGVVSIFTTTSTCTPTSVITFKHESGLLNLFWTQIPSLPFCADICHFFSSVTCLLLYYLSRYHSVWGTLLVAQLVEALCYKLEGRGFDSRWCHWDFSLTQSFRPRCGPGVDSAPIRNDSQE
jgi:hypothetical protein